MYEAGERISEITSETGLSRPTIYWVLRTKGVRPQRNVREDELPASDLAEMLRQSEREVGRLQERLRQIEEGE
jgi:AcrR family transcriptional regulator